ncbi:hypothetical protein ACH4ZU_35585 [Streptomyces sp. NPDC020472]|uniref:hypothetical protein n=1 Tax=Streptomyces sp. NPDC020472 TaxID=3365075 RepID=UPI00378B7286
MASDEAKPCSVTVRGAPSRTRRTGGSPSHASPGAVAGATGSAPDGFRARHLSNMPTFSSFLSQ